MKAAEIVASYLAALERADLDGVLKLFTPDAVVHSPLHGQLPAAQFYPALFADTGAVPPDVEGHSAVFGLTGEALGC